MSTASPSPNGANGRDGSGRFAKGNRGGPGNPLAARVTRLQLPAVTEKDIVRSSDQTMQ